MTEAEWLACNDPLEMLEALSGVRSMRLFACACCRRIWRLMTDERCRRAVEVAERFADGEATEEERQAADADCVEMDREATAKAIEANVESVASSVASAAGGAVGPDWTFDVERADMFYFADNPAEAVQVEQRSSDAKKAEFAAQVALIHEIFGNPYRPVSVDPAWLTADVVALAHAAYAERILPEGHLEPQRLAVLADALEEAGCADASILAHLRGEGPHVRGCWVIDLVLGKE
jgi:hypothetical protein